MPLLKFRLSMSYEAAVQHVETDLNLVDGCTNAITNGTQKIYEDFCGTAPCYLLGQQHPTYRLRYCLHTLEWGRQHHLASLTRDEQARIDLRCERLTTQP